MTDEKNGRPAHRYPYLDALRGIAAILVVLYHIGRRFGAESAINGYLAVDFFFVLSGFVLASAYESKLGLGLTQGRFIRKRAIRLMPLSVLSVLIGTVYTLLRYKIEPSASDPLDLLLTAALLNLFLLPKLWHAPASNDDLFPVNPVLWSLFFEFLVNVLWAAIMPRAKLPVLFIIMGLAAIVYANGAMAFGNPSLGWDTNTLVGGAGRTIYGFLLGVILCRLRNSLTTSSRFVPMLALPLLALFIFVPDRNLSWTLFGAMVAMPLAVVLGLMAGTRHVIPLERTLGTISYPLYAIHLPLLMVASGVSRELELGPSVQVWAPLLVIPLVAMAYLIAKFFDEPVRARLERQTSLPSIAVDAHAVQAR